MFFGRCSSVGHLRDHSFKVVWGIKWTEETTSEGVGQLDCRGLSVERESDGILYIH